MPRIVLAAAVCGIAPESTALAVNLTVVQPSDQGHLTVYPGNLAPPLVSNVNFGAGQTRANSAIVPLATNGAGTLGIYPFLLGQGRTHLIVDVFGYFAPEPLTRLESSSPLDEESDVAVTRETVLRFDAPLSSASVTADAVFAEASGTRLPARLYLSRDGRTVTLFYDDPLPASGAVRVWVDGERLRDTRGRKVDADRNGVDGGVADIDFGTLSLTVLPGTVVCGRVVASELGTTGSGATVDVPLEGATVTVDGAEATLRATTDANGNFCLDPAPGSFFFVHIDGRTATNGVPAGSYYPHVGKAWNPVPGRRTNVGTAYLPLVKPGTLQPVSAAADTEIHFSPAVLQDFPEFADVSITVPAGALFADDGTPGGMVGIAPVPPDRLPGQLPAGLEFPVVITVQTDGATNFDSPAPVCFPNLPDPATGETLPSGGKSALWSFNHDSGRWEHAGSMTGSADGRLVCSDPGFGILAPGWHAAGPPPLAPPPKPPGCPSPEPCLPEPVPPPGPEPVPPPLPPPPPLPCPGNPGYDTCLDDCKHFYRKRQEECTSFRERNRAVCTEIFGIFRVLPLPARLRRALKLVHLGCRVSGHAGGGYCHLDSLLDNANCEFDCARSHCPIPGRSSQQARNNDPVLDLIADAGQQMLSLLQPFVASGTRADAIPEAVFEEIEGIWANADAAAGGDAMRYFDDHLAERERAVANVYREPLGNAPARPVLYMAQIQRSAGELALRGKTLPFGQYGLAVPGDGELFQVIVYDPVTHSYDVIRPHSRPEAPFRLPRFHLEPVAPDLKDSDGDALADLVEAVYGTALYRQDTDGDGTGDGQEVSLGTDPLGREVEIGDVVEGAVAFAGELDRYTFTAMAGQEVFLDLQAGADIDLAWRLADSAGNPLFDRRYYADEGPIPLTRGGTYTLTVGDADSAHTGSYRFQIWDVPPPDTFAVDIGDTISNGVPGPGAGNIETPGVRDVYTFSAAAGQAVYFDLQDGRTIDLSWELLDPAGNTVFDYRVYADAGPFTLPLGGVYTLTVGQSQSDYTGTYRFRLWDVPPHDTFAVDIGDTIGDGVPGPGAGNIETPGVRDGYTFHASAGQSVYFDLQAGNTIFLSWKLVDPSGATLFDYSLHTDPGVFTLLLAGTYTLTVGKDQTDYTGTYRFRTWNVPPPDTFTLAPGDTVSRGVPGPGAGYIEVPGARDVYTFSTAPGQSALFDLQAGGTHLLDWTLVDSTGTVIFDRFLNGDAGPYTLNGGTYTLTIGRNWSDYTGTYAFYFATSP